MMRSSRVSMFHQDVSDVIAAMQIEHQMEYLAEDGIFSVDVAVIRDEQKVAIEVDGPYHYTLNTHQPLGHTLLRSACSFQCLHCSHNVDVLLWLHQECSSLVCRPWACQHTGLAAFAMSSLVGTGCGGREACSAWQIQVHCPIWRSPYRLAFCCIGPWGSFNQSQSCSDSGAILQLL